jgi:hypothetical protein
MENFVNRAFIVPLQQLSEQIVGFLPNLLAMFAILVFGITAGVVCRWLLGRGLKYFRFDDFAHNAGLRAVLLKANIHQSPAMLIANVVYGIFVLLALVLGLNALNLQATSGIVTGIFVAIPKLIVGVIIFVVGYLLSQFLGRSVLIAAVNAQWRTARLVAYGVQGLMLLFTVSISLEQIGLGRNTIIAAFSIVFGGMVLALAIAFGLGGRGLAREFLERRLKAEERQNQKTHPFSHL